MTKYREILRLPSLGISQRSIASSWECSRNTVAKVLYRAGELNLFWPLPEGTTDGDLAKKLFPKPTVANVRKKRAPMHIPSKQDWYSLTINTMYHEMAEYYSTAIIPARIRNPKGKPSVKSAVGAISRDTGIPATSVRAYFDILSETFVGFLLQPWRGSKKRKAVATAKFYFFDVGVANFLNEVKSLNPNSSDFGKAFEHFIAMELRSCLSYRREKKTLTYWRTPNGNEVDFVVGKTSAVEVKSAARIHDKHLKGLRMLREEGVFKNFFLVCLDETDRLTSDGIRILHWKSFLDKLWKDKLEL